MIKAADQPTRNIVYDGSKTPSAILDRRTSTYTPEESAEEEKADRHQYYELVMEAHALVKRDAGIGSLSTHQKLLITDLANALDEMTMTKWRKQVLLKQAGGYEPRKRRSQATMRAERGISK